MKQPFVFRTCVKRPISTRHKDRATINIFIRLNDKMMNRISFKFGNTFPLTIYNEPSCTSARLYTVLLYISAD